MLWKFDGRGMQKLRLSSRKCPSLKQCPQAPPNTWIAIYLTCVLGCNQSCAIA